MLKFSVVVVLKLQSQGFFFYHLEIHIRHFFLYTWRPRILFITPVMHNAFSLPCLERYVILFLPLDLLICMYNSGDNRCLINIIYTFSISWYSK